MREHDVASNEDQAAERRAAADLPEPSRRRDIRPPRFADTFAVLDFEAEPMPVISMFEPPRAVHRRGTALVVRDDRMRNRAISWARLDALPQHALTASFVCQIFNWHEEVRWRGLRLSDVLDAVGFAAHPEGYYAFISRDGAYFETLSVDEARDPRVMLAVGMGDGQIPPEHGGPLRLVVPFLQGYKSVKWLGAIQSFRHDPAGIKRLLGQSKSGRLGPSWMKRLAIVPAEGRAGDP